MPQRPLRVLAIIPGDGQGSSYIFARREVAALNALGCEMHTLFLGSRSSARGLLAERKRIKSAIRTLDPDVVHAHYGTITAFVTAASVGSRPLVVTFRGSDLNGDPGVSQVRASVGQLLSQISALRSAHIICVSERLRARLWSRSASITVIPSGIDLELFRPIERDEARRHLHLDPARPIVLFNAGRRPLLKGQALVEAAVDRARSRVPDLELLSLSGDIAPEEMPWWINAADCVVLASMREGSPGIVKEALACNVPVVATDVGDVAERLRGVEPSRVVDRDPDRFGDALASVLLERRRSNGREHVQDLDERELCERVMRVYEVVSAARTRTR